MAYDIFLNTEKYKFCVRQGVLLGHIVSKADIAVGPSKVKAIVALVHRSVDVTEVKSFLGHTGYYRRSIKGYAVIAMPKLHSQRNLKVNESTWTAECQTASEALKTTLVIQVVIPPDWSKELKSYVYILEGGSRRQNIE